jgi:hypothetical protein
MADVNQALVANREAVADLLAAAERCGNAWLAPRAPGKWSPSQIVEHVARSLEESANVVAGEPSKFPAFPFFLRPVVRGFLFNRVLRNGAFPKGENECGDGSRERSTDAGRGARSPRGRAREVRS